MLKINIQLFGGRSASSGMSESTSGGGYGMSGTGEKPTLNKVLNGKDVDELAYKTIDEKNYGAGREAAEEKYGQLRKVAEGDFSNTDYGAGEFIRINAGSYAGPEYADYYGKTRKTYDTVTGTEFGGWKLDQSTPTWRSGESVLLHDLGSQAERTINNATQRAARKWLNDNPDRSGQKGWRFNGKKWVQR